jgi:HAD superfamily phosphoserine phosphatase-like hydrolase
MPEPVKLAVFDLNGTFYNKSSKDEFFKFICSKKPRKIRYWLQMRYYKLLLKWHRINQTEFKENFFNYLNGLSPETVTEFAKEFWMKEYPAEFNREIMNRLEILKSEGTRIVCATGALEVYAAPLFRQYSIDALFGTKANYNGKTYLVDGKACKGNEKLRRIKEHFKNEVEIVEAYSDSCEEILDEAGKAFLVKNGKLEPYHNGRYRVSKSI